MSKNILIIATNKVEDVEMLAPFDIWKRAGFEVDIATETDTMPLVTGKGLKINFNYTMRHALQNLSNYDILFIPGGSHVSTLDLLPEVDLIIKHFFENDKIVAAICASPTLLAKRGYLKDRHAICYNGKKEREMLLKGGAIISNPECKAHEPCEVVIDKKLITGLKMQSTIVFAEEAVKLFDKLL